MTVLLGDGSARAGGGRGWAVTDCGVGGVGRRHGEETLRPLGAGQEPSGAVRCSERAGLRAGSGRRQRPRGSGRQAAEAGQRQGRGPLGASVLAQLGGCSRPGPSQSRGQDIPVTSPADGDEPAAGESCCPPTYLCRSGAFPCDATFPACPSPPKHIPSLSMQHI